LHVRTYGGGHKVTSKYVNKRTKQNLTSSAEVKLTWRTSFADHIISEKVVIEKEEDWLDTQDKGETKNLAATRQ